MPFPKHLPPLPDLPTLHEHPSWCNLRGHVDRSACIELPARYCTPLLLGQPMVPAPSPGGRVAAATVVMPSTWLDFLMNKHWDRSHLNGDYRHLAPAMRPDPRGRGVTFSINQHRPLYHPDTRLRAKGPDHDLPPNPNRGNLRTKTHGLPLQWTQPLSLERWATHTIQPGQRTARRIATRTEVFTCPYLVCPGFDGPLPRDDGGDQILPARPPAPGVLQLSYPERYKQDLSAMNPGYAARRDRYVPCRRGEGRRVRMLMLPQATPQEIADAAVAQAWLAAVAEVRGDYPGGPPRLTTLELQVIDRYRLLFAPRRLVCAACLAVRWGAIRAKTLPESRRGYFTKKPRPTITLEKTTPVMRQLNQDWKLVKAYHKSVKRTQTWIDRLALLQAETDPEKIVNIIDKYWGNPHRASIARQRKRQGLPNPRKALAAFLAQIDREDGIK